MLVELHIFTKGSYLSTKLTITCDQHLLKIFPLMELVSNILI